MEGKGVLSFDICKQEKLVGMTVSSGLTLCGTLYQGGDGSESQEIHHKSILVIL